MVWYSGKVFLVFDCVSGKAIEVFWGNDRKVHEFHGRLIGDHALLSNKNNSHTPNTYSQVAPLDNGVNSEKSFLIKNVNLWSLITQKVHFNTIALLVANQNWVFWQTFLKFILQVNITTYEL
jgi:hypothetical protein